MEVRERSYPTAPRCRILRAMEPQFRFCTSADGTRIAYAIYGSGPPLLWARYYTLSMDALFTIPEARAYLDALAARDARDLRRARHRSVRARCRRSLSRSDGA